MQRRRLLFIGIAALLVGSISSSAVYHSLQKRITRPLPGVAVVVAARDLTPGESLAEGDLRVLTYPSGYLPEGTMHSTADAIRRSVLLPVDKGEFLTSRNVALDGEKDSLEHLIPSGMRAASVSVDDVTSVAGFVRPGSLVDVMETGQAPETHRMQSMTVLQRVRVLATGAQMEGTPAKASREAHVVTLLVTPENAERLAFATQQGRIQLVIRNPLDAGQEERNPVDGLGRVPPAKKQIQVKSAPEPAPAEHEIDVDRGGRIERIKVKEAPPTPYNRSRP